MFYIDSFNQDNTLTFDDAVKMINSSNKENGLLENMTAMRNKLVSLQNQEDFCDDWCYEINAYNKVFSDMSKLFNQKTLSENNNN